MIKLKEQNSLPSSEHNFPVTHRQRFTAVSHQHASDMGMSIETFLLAVAHRFWIPMFQIVVLIPFIDGNILVASFFEIVPESLLRFIDLQYRRSMASEDVHKSILALMIMDKFLYIICDIYDIKRLLGLVHLTMETIHFFD